MYDRRKLDAVGKARMEKRIVVRKMHSTTAENESDSFIPDPEECLDIVEKLRREAGKFLYGDTTTFRRTITVTRKTQR